MLFLLFLLNISLAPVSAVDSIRLIAPVIDTGAGKIVYPDSAVWIWFYNKTAIDSSRVYDTVGSHIEKKIKASDGSNHLGEYTAEVRLYKGNYASGETYHWLVIDGGLFALGDTTKAQAKKTHTYATDTVAVALKTNSVTEVPSDTANIKVAVWNYESRSLTDKSGFTGTMNISSTDAIYDTLLLVLRKSDSTIIAHLPWNNQLVSQSSRRIQYAESLGTQSQVDSAQIARSVWNDAIVPQLSRTISTSQSIATVSGSVGSVVSPVTVGTNTDKTGYTTTAADKKEQADSVNNRLGKLDVAVSSRMSSADSVAIARSVWSNSIVQNRTIRYVDTARTVIDTVNVRLSQAEKRGIGYTTDTILSSRHGSGNWSYSIAGSMNVMVTFKNKEDSVAIPTVLCNITNRFGNIVDFRYSNADGRFFFTCDTGVYILQPQKYFYTFAWDTIHVTSNTTRTIWGSAWQLPQPRYPNLCNVFGTLRTATLQPYKNVKNAVKARIVSPPKFIDSTGIIIDYSYANTDSLGRFSIQLSKGADYQFMISAAEYDSIVTIPDTVNSINYQNLRRKRK